MLEQVQRRAVRMIDGIKGTYEEKLQILGLTTLKDRRERGDAIHVFKIMKGLDPLRPEDLYQFINHGLFTHGSDLRKLTDS